MFAQLATESLYSAKGHPFSLLKTAPSHRRSGPPSNSGSLGPPESTTWMASRLVQPSLQGSWLWQTNQPTDRPCYSCICVVLWCSLIILYHMLILNCSLLTIHILKHNYDLGVANSNVRKLINSYKYRPEKYYHMGYSGTRIKRGNFSNICTTTAVIKTRTHQEMK